LHFLLPFVLLAFIIIHLLSLHITGSKSPLGINPNIDKIKFHPYFTAKDLLGILILIYFLIFLRLILTYDSGDPENFNPANPLNTPIHIQPE
jgi:ubiquinol-cytochrome c reductase cytochrome b subunit